MMKKQVWATVEQVFENMFENFRMYIDEESSRLSWKHSVDLKFKGDIAFILSHARDESDYQIVIYRLDPAQLKILVSKFAKDLAEHDDDVSVVYDGLIWEHLEPYRLISFDN